MYLNHSLSDPLRVPREGRLPWDRMTDHVLDIWKAASPSLDLIAPDIYMSSYRQYVKVLDAYHRQDNAMFIPESGNAAPYARYFFAALGHQAIGWSTFGLDLTGYANAPLGAPIVDDKLIDTFALNFEIAGSMQRQLAQLNFEGKLKAATEDPRFTANLSISAHGQPPLLTAYVFLVGRAIPLAIQSPLAARWSPSLLRTNFS